MGEKRRKWILAAALLLAVDVLLLPSRAVERADWGEMLIRGVETAVFLAILGAAVKGVKSMGLRVWLGTAAMAGAAMPLELLSWHLWSGIAPEAFFRAAKVVILISAGELLTVLLIIAAMSLILYRNELRNRGARLQTLGKTEWFLCLALMITFVAAGILAQWYQVVSFLNMHRQFMEQVQSGDPMVILGSLVGMTTSPRMVWMKDVYRACRLLLKALWIWVMACGILGLPNKGRTEAGSVV